MFLTITDNIDAINHNHETIADTRTNKEGETEDTIVEIIMLTLTFRSKRRMCKELREIQRSELARICSGVELSKVKDRRTVVVLAGSQDDLIA